MNLIKEELENLKVNEAVPALAKKAASLLDPIEIGDKAIRKTAELVTGGDVDKAEEFSAKSMSPHIKRLTDEVIKLKKKLRTMQAQIKNMSTGSRIT